MDMKKGDKVLVANRLEPEYSGVYDHEFEGRHFAKFEGDTLAQEFKHCRPAKQSVDEWTVEWLRKNQPKYANLPHAPFMDDYYNDRKAWEAEQ